MVIPTQSSLYDYLNVYSQKVTDEALPYFQAIYANPAYAAVQSSVAVLIAGLTALAPAAAAMAVPFKTFPKPPQVEAIGGEIVLRVCFVRSVCVSHVTPIPRFSAQFCGACPHQVSLSRVRARSRRMMPSTCSGSPAGHTCRRRAPPVLRPTGAAVGF